MMRLHHPHALQGWAAGARARLLRRIGIQLKGAPEVYVKKVCLADSLREHPILLIYRGNPCTKKIQTHEGASALSEEKPEQQRHEGSWTFDMSNAEAIKLINNIKFEEGPTISTALGPYTTHFWAREIAVFLTRISAVHLVA